jgi:hypothetical protein
VNRDDDATPADAFGAEPEAPRSHIAARLRDNLPLRSGEHALWPIPAPAEPDVATLAPAELGTPAAAWTYRDAEGRPLVLVLRFEATGGRPRHVILAHGECDERTGWHPQRPSRPAPLYRLPELGTAPGAPVIMAESEAAAERIAAAIGASAAATALLGGWRAADRADLSPLRGRAVILAGRPGEGMDGIAAAIRAAGASSVAAVSIGAELADMPPAVIAARIRAARPHSEAPPPHARAEVIALPPPETWEETIARLAAMDDVALAGAWREAARQHRKALADLKAAVKAARRERPQSGGGGGASGSAVLPPDERGRRPLRVDAADLPDTAAELVRHLAQRPHLFDRGGPARLVHDAQRGGMVAQPLTPEGVVNETHAICRPYREEWKENVLKPKPVTLPPRVAMLALDLPPSAWGLRPLDGIASSPLLAEGGGVRVAEGYDEATRMWCERMPPVELHAEVSRDAAEAALERIRFRFRTFPFADAKKIHEPGVPVPEVDLSAAPGQDESAFLAALLTAVARPSLPLAPGLVVRAAASSGAGTGKGLLVRAICLTAYGRPPHVVTYARDPEEQEKRIAAALLEAAPAVLLDNMNGAALRSDTLATAMTERPANIRPLGKSTTVPINPTTFLACTGNGLTISEDLTRRFLMVEMDAGMEDPTRRPFRGDFLAAIEAERAALLADVLTIWRWGRIQGGVLPEGAPIGSFGTWARWCRDPLVALGCADPVLRLSQLNANDPRRRQIAELFVAIWEGHGAEWWRVAELKQAARDVADPDGRGRQYLANRIRTLEGTRAAGFVLIRHAPEGKHSADRYRLAPHGAEG